MKDSLIGHLEVKRADPSKVFGDKPQLLFDHPACSDLRDSDGNWEEYVIDYCHGVFFRQLLLLYGKGPAPEFWTYHKNLCRREALHSW